jgi:tyrosyl-tRNA synthetase
MALLRAVNVPIEKLEFVLGSDYQRTPEYFDDLLKLTTIVSQQRGQKAGADVVKQSGDPPISGLIYPLMQTLDEEFLKVDAQFGGVDQRKIFALATEMLDRIGYQKRAHLMNPMVPGLAGGKMSASEEDSKIDLLDTPEVVKRKIRKAVLVEGKLEENGMISFVEYVLMPVSGLSREDRKGRFEVETREGETIVYEDIKILKEDYASLKVPRPPPLNVSIMSTKLTKQS